jgi:hypothetical protein
VSASPEHDAVSAMIRSHHKATSRPSAALAAFRWGVFASAIGPIVVALDGFAQSCVAVNAEQKMTPAALLDLQDTSP